MTGDGVTNPWGDIVAPCYTVTSMARALGWTEVDVVEAGAQLRLLMLRTDNDVVLFPSFQLLDETVVAGLTRVLRILETGTKAPWTWAQWLNIETPGADPPHMLRALGQRQVETAISTLTAVSSRIGIQYLRYLASVAR